MESLLERIKELPAPVLYALGAALALWILSKLVLVRRRRPLSDPVHEVSLSLGCSREQAIALLQEFGNDPARAVMEVKHGRKQLAQSQLSGWAVLLSETVEARPQKLIELLTEVSGMTPADAARCLKGGTAGVVAEGLVEDMAVAFAEKLCQHEIPAKAVSTAELSVPRFAGDIRSLAYQQDALVIKTTSEARNVPWQDLIYLSLGCLVEDGSKARSPWIEAGRGRIIGQLYVRSQEGLLRYALEAGQLGFGHLGGRKQSTSVANMQLVVNDISERAPGLRHDLERFFQERKLKVYTRRDQLEGASLGPLLQALEEKQTPER